MLARGREQPRANIMSTSTFTQIPNQKAEKNPEISREKHSKKAIRQEKL